MVLVLLGCHSAEVHRIEAETQRLEARARRLREELDRLNAAADRAAAYWAHRKPVRVPAGYDPRAALPAPGDRPDLLLLSIDTLRADHLGSYGYDRDTSPFLDRLAAGGTRYADFWSPAPWTLPSHATLLSGLLPDRHGAFEDTTRIEPTVPLLQETLAESGYRTAGVVSTLFVSRKFGFDRGFDFFEDFDITDPAANNRDTVDAEEVFATAHHWAQSQPDGVPLFLFLHSYDVHYAYNAPPPFDSTFDRATRMGDARYRNYRYYQSHPLSPDQLEHQIAQYDEEIRYVDAQLEAFVSQWRGSGRDLLVVVTSDHGEEFGERGSWGHAHTLYPEQLRVPLVVNGPGVRTQIVAERAGTEDLASTLAAHLGAAHTAGDGRDRGGQLRQGGKVGTSGLYAETSRFETTRVRVHADGHDLIVDLADGSEELFDLGSDPGAIQNLRADGTARATALRQRLSERLGTPWVPNEPGTPVPIGQARVWREGLATGVLDEPFQVFPSDGRFRWEGAHPAGPWSARLGPRPDENGPVRYRGPAWTGETVKLSGEETRMLEELGYLQD